MLHHSRQGDGERGGDLGDRQLRFARQPIHDRAPGGIGQRREGKIELGV